MAINKQPNPLRPNGIPLLSISKLAFGIVRKTAQRLSQKHRSTHPKAIPNKAHLMERSLQKISAYPSSFIQSHFSTIPVNLANEARKAMEPATAIHPITFTLVFFTPPPDGLRFVFSTRERPCAHHAGHCDRRKQMPEKRNTVICVFSFLKSPIRMSSAETFHGVVHAGRYSLYPSEIQHSPYGLKNGLWITCLERWDLLPTLTPC